MSITDEALFVLRSKFPDYNANHVDGRWVARYRPDLLAPVLEAESASELPQLIASDLATRQAGGDGA